MSKYVVIKEEVVIMVNQLFNHNMTCIVLQITTQYGTVKESSVLHTLDRDVVIDELWSLYDRAVCNTGIYPIVSDHMQDDLPCDVTAFISGVSKSEWEDFTSDKPSLQKVKFGRPSASWEDYIYCIVNKYISRIQFELEFK